MSWLDSLSNLGSGVSNFLGSGIGSTILKTVVSGAGLYLVSQSVNKKSDTERDQVKATERDPGQLVKPDANTENKIPVLYGRLNTAGKQIDVRMSNSNQRMTYVYAIAERTGPLMSTGAASSYQLHRVYWSGYRINFKSDGITAASLEDLQGNTRNEIDGLVKVWFYAGSSTEGLLPVGHSGSVPPAWAVVPGWTASWQAQDLLFAVVEVNYNRTKSITAVGNMTFDIENSLSLPGDVMYDYMTNTRYGCGIPASDIRVS